MCSAAATSGCPRPEFRYKVRSPDRRRKPRAGPGGRAQLAQQPTGSAARPTGSAPARAPDASACDEPPGFRGPTALGPLATLAQRCRPADFSKAFGPRRSHGWASPWRTALPGRSPRQNSRTRHVPVAHRRRVMLAHTETAAARSREIVATSDRTLERLRALRGSRSFPPRRTSCSSLLAVPAAEVFRRLLGSTAFSCATSRRPGAERVPAIFGGARREDMDAVVGALERFSVESESKVRRAGWPSHLSPLTFTFCLPRIGIHRKTKKPTSTSGALDGLARPGSQRHRLLRHMLEALGPARAHRPTVEGSGDLT